MAVGIGPRHPQREDVVVVLVVGIVDEVNERVGIVRCQEITNHFPTIAGNDDKLADACIQHGIESTLQQCPAAHGEKTLRTMVRQGAQPLGHARS